MSHSNKQIQLHTSETQEIHNVCDQKFRDKSPPNDHLLTDTENNSVVFDDATKQINPEMIYSESAENISLSQGKMLHDDQMQNHPEITCTESASTVCNTVYQSKNHINSHLSHTGGKRFVCKVCNKAFQNNYRLKRHLQSHTGEKPFVCKICNKGFRDFNHFNRHTVVHSEKPEVCNICKKRFREKCTLKSHLLKHAGHASYAFKDAPMQIHPEIMCNESAVISKDKMLLNDKMEKAPEIISNKSVVNNVLSRDKILPKDDIKHDLEMIYAESASSFCDKGSKDHLNKRFGDTGKYRYFCGVCNKGFQDRRHLNRHFVVHTGEKPFVCTVCDKGFRDRNHLKRHSYVHTVEKPEVCSVCDKGFRDKCSLKNHFVTHTRCNPAVTDKAPLQMHSEIISHESVGTSKDEMLLKVSIKKEPKIICSKSVVNDILSKDQMVQKSHVKNNPVMICNESVDKECDKIFQSKNKFDRHHLRKTSEKPCVCIVCDKGFKDNYHLKRHLQSHTCEKPFICNICNKGFRDMSHLNRHSLVHTREKPKVCTLCGKAFPDKSALKSHLLKHVETNPETV